MTRAHAIQVLVLHCQAGVADLSQGNEMLIRLGSDQVVNAMRMVGITDPELDHAMTEINEFMDSAGL